MLPLSGVLKTIFLIFASVVLWETIVTPTQIVGCIIATAGLLYYSLGKDRIHSLLFPWLEQSRAEEKSVKRRRIAKRKFAIVVVLLSASAGAIGGGYAGYDIEWDPRVYWHSAQRVTVGALEESLET